LYTKQTYKNQMKGLGLISSFLFNIWQNLYNKTTRTTTFGYSSFIVKGFKVDSTLKAIWTVKVKDIKKIYLW
jgi:hypothetical protein